jgi:glycosyltransferase involved in cell wall biosynthesis
MLTHEFPPGPGGVAPYVHNLSKRLVQRGHNVTVISRGSWRKSDYEKIDGISVYRVRFVPWYPSPFWLHGVWVNRMFKSLESDLDLLHVHGALVPLVHTSIPTVFTSHGTLKKDISNMPIKSFHFFVVKILSPQLFNVERGHLKRADVITTVSKSGVEELIKYYGIDKGITVIGNGVDCNVFAPAQKKQTNEPYILYTGRLETRKGLVDLIESARYVCQKHSSLKFVLVGKGTIEQMLKAMVSKLGLEQNFLFAGYTSNRDKLIEYYRNATIYVLPSYYEGLPTSLLEAMACGIPSIATNVEGSSEVITDGETGLLVPPRNPKSLAEATLKLLDDEELRDRMGANGRAHIVNNYDWESIVNRIESIYCAIAGSKPSSR